MQYVGETGRALADRMNDHRSNIRNNKKTPLAAHINSHTKNGGPIKFKVQVIEQISDSIIRRLNEQTWQNRLGTKHPNGINEPNTIHHTAHM